MKGEEETIQEGKGRGTLWRMFPRTRGRRWLLLVPLGKTLFFVLVRDFQLAAACPS
jgi:hypothetical protein